MYIVHVHHDKNCVHSEKARNERPIYVGSLCMKKLKQTVIDTQQATLPPVSRDFLLLVLFINQFSPRSIP
jgi:hypothetical protein